MDIVDEIRSDPDRGAKRLDVEYRVGLTTLALRFCHDASDAEELVNRTFTEVCRSIDRYAEQSAFFAWMSRIMTNIHANDVRRKSCQNEVLDGKCHESESDPDLEAAIYRDVDASILREAIDTLPPDERKAVVMHYFLDIPVREAARILSVPTGTFAWRLHNARMFLAARLGAFVKKPGAKTVLLSLAAALLLAASAAIVAFRIENGELRIENGESGIENGELRIENDGGDSDTNSQFSILNSQFSNGRAASPLAADSTNSQFSILNSQFSSPSTGDQEMQIKNAAASAAFATLLFMPARASSAGASCAEATFDSFNSSYGGSGEYAPEAFLSRYRTMDDSNALGSFSSYKPRGFAVNIR